MKYLLMALFWAGVIIEIGNCQNYEVDWYVIGSGGGHSQSSSYQIDGTIGQPIAGHSSSTNYQVDAGFWVGTTTSPSCEYFIGDINGDGQRLGGDVTFGVRYFKGIGSPPPDSCYMDSTARYLYVAGDVNADCLFRGSDITRFVSYFKGYSQLAYCHFFPPPPLRYNSTQPIILMKEK